MGPGAGEGSAEDGEALAGAEEQHEEAERVRREQREGEDAALAAWARHPSHAAWKTLEWLVQVRREGLETVSKWGQTFATVSKWGQTFATLVRPCRRGFV